MHFIKIFDLVVQKVMPALNKIHKALNFTAHLSLAIISNKFKAQFKIQTWILKCSICINAPQCTNQFYRGKYYGLVRIWIWKLCLCTQMELLRKAHGHSMLLACGFHMKIKIMIRFKEIIIQREKQVFSGNMSMEQELSVS